MGAERNVIIFQSIGLRRVIRATVVIIIKVIYGTLFRYNKKNGIFHYYFTGSVVRRRFRARRVREYCLLPNREIIIIVWKPSLHTCNAFPDVWIMPVQRQLHQTSKDHESNCDIYSKSNFNVFNSISGIRNRTTATI